MLGINSFLKADFQDIFILKNCLSEFKQNKVFDLKLHLSNLYSNAELLLQNSLVLLIKKNGEAFFEYGCSFQLVCKIR